MAIIPQIITEDRASGAQVIDGSLKFDSTAGDHLLRTPSTSGNRRVWTWSGWVKRKDLDSFRRLFEAGSSTSNFTTITWQGDNNSIELMSRTGGTNKFRVKTARLFRDLSAWYHVVVSMNILSETQTDRCKIYINGERITDFDDNTQQNNVEEVSFVNGTDNHFIGSANNEASTYNGYMSQIYLIDGIELDPSYFGFTDPLTGTWRPKKYTGNVNYVSPVGQVDYESGFNGQSMQNVDTSWLPFVGNTSNSGYSQSKNTTLTYTAPGSGISYTSTIRLFCKNGSGGKNNITIDGTSFSPSTGSGNNTGAWNDISTYVTGGALNTIVTSRGSSGRNTYWSAIEVDGVILTHLQPGYNGFYLPFDGNSPIGEDKSGNGNNWTPVNFGGSNSIEKATGALPILNTVNGGTTATTTVREDANASNLVLAVALNGNTQDYSGQINNNRTPLTFSVNGNAAPTTAQSNFYGGSYTFDGTTDSVYSNVPNNDALFLQNSNSTVECWARIASGQTDDRYFITLASGSQTNNDGSWYLRIFQSKFEFVIVDGGTQYKTVSVNNYVPDKWTHIAFVREGNVQRLYIDGVLETTEGYTVFPNLNNSSTIFIGSSYDYNNTINAQIQDARIYDNLAKYTSNFIPASTNPDIRPDTPSGVAYGSELKQITEGSVNGGVSNGDTLLIGNSSDFNFGSGDFTVELFAYHTSTAGNDTLLGIWNSGANKRSWMIDIEADQGRLRGYWSTAGSNNSSVQTATNYIARRRWNHIVFCRQGNTMRLYLNGNQEATATESGSLYNNTDDSLGILSATDAGNDPCRGHISNVRIIKGTCLYPDGTSFTPPSAPLTNVTNTVLLGCQSPTNPAEFQVGAAGTTYTTEGSVSPSAYSNQLWRLFDNNNGTFWGHTSQNSNSGYVTYTFPGSGIPFTQLEIAGSNYNSLSVKVNGVEFTNWGTDFQSPPWHDITSSVTSPLTSVSVYGNGSGQTSTMSRIRINGSILVDAVTVKESVSASAFNPFTDDINTVRGQENAYCILNAAATYNGDGGDIQDGGLKFECPASGDASTRGTIPIPAGSKFYMEAKYKVAAGSSGQARLGITQVQQGFTKSGTGMWSIDFRGSAGTIQKDDEGSLTTLTGNPSDGDTVGIKIDLATGEFRAHHRGIYYNGGNALMTGIPNVESYFFAALDGGVNRNDWEEVNFGQKPWKYPPGDGYQPLCSANLPRPTKAALKPDKHFNTVLWTGDDSTDRPITTGFRPDFVWVKARNQAYSNHLYDSVRGPSLRLLSNGIQSEFDQTSIDGVSSFNSDGFDVSHTNSDAVNQLNTTYVGWSWKGGTPENHVPSSGSIVFDGSGDYLSLADSADFSFDGDFTVEAFVYQTAQADHKNIFSTEDFDFKIRGNGRVRIYTASSGSDTTQTVTLNKWTHLALVRESGTIKVYFDGVGETVSQTIASDGSSAAEIGRRIRGSQEPFNGYISNLRVVKGTALYTSNFTPPTEPLTNVTNTKLLCCQSKTSATAAAVTPGNITANGDAYAKDYNPFDIYRVDGRVYATAAEAGLNGGTITPTGASVNTESGFSIITYTGDGNTSSGVTINHGLGDTPAFIITKKRSSGTTDNGWSCWHKDLGGNYGIWLNLTNTRNPSMWGGHTNISSTVFSPPDLNYGNENGQTYVNYLWSEVPGFSKFGTYTGNGAVNGPLIECGFRPAWVMVKVAGGSTGNSWTVWDNKRDPDNEMNLYLHPNETQDDGSYSAIKMDFYSNGFKPRGDIIHQNTDGTMYIYVAFAEAPTFNLYGGQANAR